MDFKLSQLELPIDLFNCTNKFCKNCEHTAAIDRLCDEIIQCCLEAHICTDKAIAGWNDHVKQAREQSLLWHFMWQQSGRPNHGHIYQIMKTTRHRYHYSVRWCKKNTQQIQRSKLAENIGYSDTFWSEPRKIIPATKQISETVGTAQGSSEISKLFFHKYK